MRDINRVILLGRLGADPIRRSTKKGTSVVHFSLATSKWRNSTNSKAQKKKEVNSSLSGQAKSGNLGTQVESKFGTKIEPTYEEETQWHQVVAWGGQADRCARELKKGSTVFVEGSIKTRRYDGKDGLNHLAVEVIAENVSWISRTPRIAGAPSKSVSASA